MNEFLDWVFRGMMALLSLGVLLLAVFVFLAFRDEALEIAIPVLCGLVLVCFTGWKAMRSKGGDYEA